MQQSQQLNSGQEPPSSTSYQIAPGDNDKRSDLRPPQASKQSAIEQQHQHQHQLESLDSSSSKQNNNNNNNHNQVTEEHSLLSSSGYRSQTSVEISRSPNHRNSPGNENRRQIERFWSNCCPGRDNNFSFMSRSCRPILSYFLAEMMGTFILVLIGDGSIAAYVVTKLPVDAFNACFAFGVGAMIATFMAAKISGAHLNPAATLALALDGRLKWRLVPVYMLAQYLGGFLAALVLYLNYIEAITALDGGSRSAFGSANSTGNIFATYPGEWVTVWGALLDQTFGTAMLLFALGAVTDKNNAALDEKHQPLIIAFVIGLVCFAFSPNCGAIFNPARDLAPRLLTWLVGYRSDVWKPIDGYYWLAAGVVGPHLGAILGHFGYKLLIGSSLESSKHEYELQDTTATNQCRSIHSANCDRKQMPAAKLVQISQHNHQRPHHHDHHSNQDVHQHQTTDTMNDYGAVKR